MNWRQLIYQMKKSLERNGFARLADELLMAEVTAGKNPNAIVTEVLTKLKEFSREHEAAYYCIITEAEQLRRYAKTFGIEPNE